MPACHAGGRGFESRRSRKAHQPCNPQGLGRLVDHGQQSHRRILKHRDEHVDPAIPEADYSRVIARGPD